MKSKSYYTTPSLKEADRAYKMGYTAAKKYLTLESNPYSIAQMQLHSSWAAGALTNAVAIALSSLIRPTSLQPLSM